MRERCGSFLVVAAGLAWLAGGAGAARARAADTTDWRAVVALPPSRGADGNAFLRWAHASAALPALTPDELLLTNAPSAETFDDQTRATAVALLEKWRAPLEAFAMTRGEFVAFPRVTGPEGIVPEIEAVRALTRGKRLQGRLLLAQGKRADAARSFAEMIRAGGAACEGANSLPSLLAALAILSSGLDGAEMLARDPATAATDAETIAAAIRASDGACARGLANALRGDYQLVFRVVVERLPQTTDVAVMLAAVSSLGMRTGETIEERGRLGRAENKLLDVETTLEERGRALATLIAALEDGRGRAAMHSFDAAEQERARQLRRELGRFMEFAEKRDLGEASLDEMPPVLDVLERVKNPLGKLLLVIVPVGAGKIGDVVFRQEERRREIAALLAARRE